MSTQLIAYLALLVFITIWNHVFYKRATKRYNSSVDDITENYLKSIKDLQTSFEENILEISKMNYEEMEEAIENLKKLENEESDAS